MKDYYFVINEVPVHIRASQAWTAAYRAVKAFKASHWGDPLTDLDIHLHLMTAEEVQKLKETTKQ